LSCKTVLIEENLLHLLIKDTDQQERSRPLSGDWFDCRTWCYEACLSVGTCGQVPGIYMKPNDKENSEMTSK